MEKQRKSQEGPGELSDHYASLYRSERGKKWIGQKGLRRDLEKMDWAEGSLRFGKAVGV